MPEASRDGLPKVSKASRLTSRAAGMPEASRDGLPTVSEASRLTSRASGMPEASRDGSPTSKGVPPYLHCHTSPQL
jgi:hypothetical protein